MPYLNYILILIGAIVAIYAKTGAEQNQTILIAGIVLLMLGVYRVSKSVPSKEEDSDFANDENEKNDV